VLTVLDRRSQETGTQTPICSLDMDILFWGNGKFNDVVVDHFVPVALCAEEYS